MHTLAFDPQDPATLYAGTDSGLFTSTNGGASWRAGEGRATDANVYAVAIDPQNRQTIYAAINWGVLMSTDGGASWSGVSRGLPVRTFDALAIDPVGRTVLPAHSAVESSNSRSPLNVVPSVKRRIRRSTKRWSFVGVVDRAKL